MHHVAFMNPRWRLIEKILAGKKIIESRWYQTRRTPWDRVQIGDVIFFKDSGKLVTAKAEVSRVWQFETKNQEEIEQVLKEFGERICLTSPLSKWEGALPKYVILMELANPVEVSPFSINKAGFGNAAAWITVEDIAKIRK